MYQVKNITINAPKCIPAMWHRHMVNRANINRNLIVASSELHQCQMRHLHSEAQKHWKVNMPSPMIEMTENQKIVLKIYDLEETTSSKTHELHLSFDDDGKLYVHAKEDSNVVYTDDQNNISAADEYSIKESAFNKFFDRLTFLLNLSFSYFMSSQS